MRSFVFASRNQKELLRDPLNLIFGIGFPVGLLLMFTAIQSNVPIELFVLDKVTPGLAVFGLSFISLFSGMLIAKDRESSFLMRLCASPLTATDFILGYAVPLIPIAIMQSLICFIVALFLGLSWSINILLTLVVILPSAILFIGIGLLAGSVLNDKQVGGIVGALLTNVSAILSGIWFDVNLVGGAFKTIANALPFIHGVNAAKAAMAGNYADILPELLWVSIYAIVIFTLAVKVFSKKMKNGNT